jgi:IS5 family transposase
MQSAWPAIAAATFENRIGEAGAKALFDGVSAQLLKKGFIARGGQIIDATLVPAPKQHNSRGEKALIEQGAMPAGWKPAKRRQKDLDATWTKKHGKSHFGYKLSINVDTKYKIIRKIETDTASTHDSQHFDNVFDTVNTSRDVYADRGYPSAEREAWLKENGFGTRSNEGPTQQAAVRVPAAAQHAHRQDTGAGRACVRGHRADGRQAAAHHRPGAGELCDDDDGGLLQPEAAGLFPEGRNQGLLTPEMGRIAAAGGDSRQRRDTAKKAVVCRRN